MVAFSDWQWPQIEGLNSFEGKICHTASWDKTITLQGKKVAVIGMGSSGIQVTSELAEKVERLYTWIRSPTWVTAGFAQNWAGPNGANFKCRNPDIFTSIARRLMRAKIHRNSIDNSEKTLPLT